MGKFILLYSIFFLFPTVVYAIEGNEPSLELELLPPEVKFKEFPEESLKIPEVKIPSFSIYSQFGKGKFGEEYEVKITRNNVNNALALQFIKIEDKINFDSKIEGRKIGRFNITEIGMEFRGGSPRRCKIEACLGDDWHANATLDLNERIFIGENVLKILGSCLYESEFIGDYAILPGRKLRENLFTGIGISGPRLAPFIQINGFMDNFLFSISHRSKKVTETFYNIYVKYPWGCYSDVNDEYWNSVSAIRAEIQNMSVELNYKEIGDAIFWRVYGDFIEPVNRGEDYEFEARTKLQLWKFKITSFLKHRERESNEYLYSLFPGILLNNRLDISCPYDIKISLENEYGKEREPLSDYSLFSITVAKRFGYLNLWCKVNNFTNTEYEIIKGIRGGKSCVQGGVEIRN